MFYPLRHLGVACVSLKVCQWIIVLNTTWPPFDLLMKVICCCPDVKYIISWFQSVRGLWWIEWMQNVQRFMRLDSNAVSRAMTATVIVISCRPNQIANLCCVLKTSHHKQFTLPPHPHRCEMSLFVRASCLRQVGGAVTGSGDSWRQPDDTRAGRPT